MVTDILSPPRPSLGLEDTLLSTVNHRECPLHSPQPHEAKMTCPTVTPATPPLSRAPHAPQMLEGRGAGVRAHL